MTANLGKLLHAAYFRIKTRFLSESGQDLVEYAMIIALVSFCVIAAEKNVATSISAAFTNVADTFNSEVTAP